MILYPEVIVAYLRGDYDWDWLVDLPGDRVTFPFASNACISQEKTFS
jgi:hypothetical protein